MNPYLARVHVVCMHRGLFPEAKVWQFGESIPEIGGIYGWPIERSRSGEVREVPGRVRRVRQANGPGRFRCPVCHANPRPSRAEWHRRCAALRQAGGDTLDISRLR